MRFSNTAGDNNRNRKVSSSQVRDIRAAHAGGQKAKDLAAKYKVKPATIMNIVRRRCWKSVD